MHLLLTTLLFALLTAFLIALRLSWQRRPATFHPFILALVAVALIAWPLSTVTHWNFTSDRLDSLLYWAFLAGYEFLLLLFTLLRPRWLTSLIALTLVTPILTTSGFLPLSELFARSPQPSVPLGHNLYSQLVPFTYPTSGISGTDLEVYYRPSWLPFLQRRTQGARYHQTQCDAAHAFSTLLPDGHHLLMTCPALPGEPDTVRTLVVRLR